MTKWKSSVYRGMIDGILRGIFFFLLGELVATTYMIVHFRIFMLLSCIFALLVNVVFYMINKGTFGQIFVAYGVGEIVFALCTLLTYLNDIEFHFHIFPQQEIYYGNVMDLFIAVGVYVLFSGFIRLLLIVLKSLISMGNKRR